MKASGSSRLSPRRFTFTRNPVIRPGAGGSRASMTMPRGEPLTSQLPRKSVCKGDPARMEVSLAEPIALYRKGDRPAKGLKNWADYPDGVLCAVADVR